VSASAAALALAIWTAVNSNLREQVVYETIVKVFAILGTDEFGSYRDLRAVNVILPVK
jgi:glutamate/tyrosine decarboxylase-like PLP-dependent enzyme